MTDVADPVLRYRRLIEAAQPFLPGKNLDWLEQRRTRAIERFTASGFPTRKDEHWRYSSLDGVLKQPLTTDAGLTQALDEAAISALLITQNPAARLVFCNGRLVESLSRLDRLPNGVVLRSMRDMLENDPARVHKRLGAVLQTEADALCNINTALLNDGFWLEVMENTSIDAPIEILYVCSGAEDSLAVSPRNLVHLREGAQASLIEHYAGPGASRYFTNAVSEIALCRSAVLNHTLLQEESDRAFHRSKLAIRQDASSHYRALGVNLGASWSRIDYQLRFAEPQASCRLDGLYFAADKQQSDFHLDIDHAVPGCHSQEHFKGILQGKGRAVFDGSIRVARDAQKTQAHLKNDNLMLSRAAEVDSKPQLEIFADDVQCSHGTTIGQIEDEQLFYLRSRGIDEARAKRLLCSGFINDILQNCPSADFSRYAQQRIEKRL